MQIEYSTITIEDWCLALESGEFEQEKGQLWGPVSDSYCCLGVGCKLANAMQDGEKFAMVPNSLIELRWSWTGWDGVTAFDLTDALIEPYPTFQGKLVRMNDSGKSFAEIAGFIREHCKLDAKIRFVKSYTEE